MFHSVILAAALVAPASEPIQPIDTALLTTALDTAEAQTFCDSYGSLRDATNSVAAMAGESAGELGLMFVDMIDAYFIVQFEENDIYLDREGRSIFVDWLHNDCANR